MRSPLCLINRAVGEIYRHARAKRASSFFSKTYLDSRLRGNDKLGMKTPRSLDYLS